MDDAAAWARIRERLLARGRMPALPAGWRHQSAMLSAQGYAYGGDFIVADLQESEGLLRTVLVDVCGSGESAVPAALQFAGALESLISVVPGDELLFDANTYLLRQPSDESMATAVQLDLELATGRYLIRSAGHPPALVWSAADRTWQVDSARGTALGVSETPELEETTGVLGHGDALMFYTDGVVESRCEDIDIGIAWLQETGRASYLTGWEGAAKRIIDRVDRGDDDRAVLILARC
ncbi:serine/threonine-protein phosphatase [Nocardioides albidus]|uniref:Serine/threonine-protein phosphatase n=1 Tax=Nocardioides albidus TaxID=1517589 RepID=A0A5C4VVZ2_9ACTN|nr:PP2C family protein-serine/threonine phosphatase [Nocardioides albidus]TNM39666.1 serine/threonine-protein phosphatase [Nocardioides albidus]